MKVNLKYKINNERQHIIDQLFKLEEKNLFNGDSDWTGLNILNHTFLFKFEHILFNSNNITDICIELSIFHNNHINITKEQIFDKFISIFESMGYEFYEDFSNNPFYEDFTYYSNGDEFDINYNNLHIVGVKYPHCIEYKLYMNRKNVHNDIVEYLPYDRKTYENMDLIKMEQYLKDCNISFRIENDTIIIDENNKDILECCSENITIISCNMIFNNDGNVIFCCLKEIVGNIIFNNNGNVELDELENITGKIEFNNNGNIKTRSLKEINT